MAKGTVEDKKESRFAGMTVKKSHPNRFTWRGYSYLWSQLTKAQIDKLADDPKFKHVERQSK